MALVRDLSIYGAGLGLLVGSAYFGIRRATGSNENYLKTTGLAISGGVVGAALPQLVFGAGGGVVGFVVVAPLLALGGGVSTEFF